MYNFGLLEQKRSVTDASADAFVRNYLENGSRKEMPKKIGNLFTGRVFDDLENSDLEKEVLSLPDWVNYSRIRNGQKLFSRFGPEISLLLMFKSLPECYACGNGVNVLYQTGKFTYKQNKKKFAKRLLDTAQFVQSVLTEGSFEGDKAGLKSILKIRTTHATARYLVQKKGDWNSEKYGEPINQEDMLGTLLAFSISVIEGLEKLGAKLTTQEKEDFYYVWRIAGQALGIERDLIPLNVEEGFELSDCIICHQLEGTEEGKILMESILEFVNENLMLPGFTGGAEELMHFLVDQKIINVISVPKSKYQLIKLVPLVFRLVVTLRHNYFSSRIYRTMVSAFNVVLLEATVVYFNFLGKERKPIFTFSNGQ